MQPPVDIAIRRILDYFGTCPALRLRRRGRAHGPDLRRGSPRNRDHRHLWPALRLVRCHTVDHHDRCPRGSPVVTGTIDPAAATDVTHIGHWIDGAARPGISSRTAPVTDPATGRVTGAVAITSTAEVRAAMQAASAAFPCWRDTSLTRRTATVFRFRELLNARRLPNWPD